MAKRMKKGENGQAAVATAVDSPTPVIEPIAGNPATVEERLAALETRLAESQDLVKRQAVVIVQAAENAERLAQSRKKVAELEAKMDSAKKTATAAKKAYETAVEEHFDLEENLSSGQQRLPFPPDPGPAADESATAPPAEDTPDDAWREVLLDTLGMPKSVVETLFAANLCSVGDLADFQALTPSGYQRRLTDIPGIGEAKAELILDAMTGFWARWSAEQQQALEAETLDAVREAERGRPVENEGFEDSEDLEPTEDEDSGWRDDGSDGSDE